MKHFREKKMRFVIFMALIILSLSGLAAPKEPAKAYDEYEVKAAYIYIFLSYISWPQEAFADSVEPIIIGVIGGDLYGDELKKITATKTVSERKLVFKQLKQSTPIETMKKCHLLFISSEIFRSKIKKILDSLKNFPVLTVSEVEDFEHLGGMIKFVIVKDKVRFEINKTAADCAGLKIGSKLLNSAIKVK
jgi:hypothetical protein